MKTASCHFKSYSSQSFETKGNNPDGFLMNFKTFCTMKHIFFSLYFFKLKNQINSSLEQFPDHAYIQCLNADPAWRHRILSADHMEISSKNPYT